VDGVRDAVSDVAWSPAIATVFAAVTRDGHAQLWEASSLTPLIDQVGARVIAGYREEEGRWRDRQRSFWLGVRVGVPEGPAVGLPDRGPGAGT
jgi:hypothetical protein